MTTERPDATRALPHLSAVPTPRSGVPATGFGARDAARAPVEVTAPDDPVRGRRSLVAVGALLAVVAVVAGVVAFRILVPGAPAASGQTLPEAQDEVREQPGSVVGYGQEYTYGDGLGLAVGHPQEYQPSANATGVEQGVPTRVQVVVTNRTGESFRPNTLQVTATSGGQEAVAVWDPDQGVALTGPDLSVPVGGSIQFPLAFAAADPADLRLEITPALYGYGAMVVQPS